jgi:serine phosphatase RsbU (regulator of sigma subunit)
MRALNMDDLVLLGEGEAVQKQFDLQNYVVLKRLFGLFAAAALGLSIAAIVQRDPWEGLAAAGNLLLVFAFFALRDSEFFERNFRRVNVLAILLELVFLILPLSRDGGGVALAGFIFPLLLLLFRFRISEYFLLFGTFWAATLLLLYRASGKAGQPALGGTLTGSSIVIVLALTVTLAITAQRRRVFLTEWRRQAGRSRERLRMREEIEYARKIQLAMLPQAAPEVPWIEFAGASLPATEVGGDYYDYFQLGPERLALVVGDVSGHGLASGLLLSGVRSCLYLLEEELHRPVEVLVRLHRMVRRTTDRRTFVTLLVAVLDSHQGTLSLASAGHPPLLLWSARTRKLAEVGKGALPLGTWLEPRYEQEVVPVEPGDLLVLYTDGLIEARSHFGKEYGDERLKRTVQRVLAAAAEGSARAVRDAVLEDLSSFKGDVEQADDITLVVVKVR